MAAFAKGSTQRVFPISNRTELDVRQYIAEEALEVRSMYLAHDREVLARELYAVRPCVELMDGETPVSARVRYRYF
jgi:sulfate adenylyltransferase subunit 2